MALFRKLLKGTKVVWAFAYSLTKLVFTRPKSRRARAEWLTDVCRRVLRAVDVTWATTGPVPEHGAVITNHLSYVDILVHSAMRPCVFVSAIETRRLPLLGWMSMMAGTVYVKRGVGGSAAKAAGGMIEGFQDGLPVVFFPEGGTGVGDVPLLPLHSGLLANALEAGAPVTAGFIRYLLAPEDVALGKSSRNEIAWGKQTLPAHIWNLLGLRSFHADILFAPEPIPFSPGARADRKVAAEEATAAILGLVGGTKVNSAGSLLK
ncbi:MAG TPA: lysophospholipid acyltransferase family protein [Acidobacteriaceae bacterium]|nr:lysophospholipid acyltransferase family protein [Acidobacteriaceae bacterium]